MKKYWRKKGRETGLVDETCPANFSHTFSISAVQPMRSILKKKSLIDSLPPKKGCKMTLNSVTFDRVETREFNRTIGDNPAVSSGIPIGLDWSYKPHHKIQKLDDYERKKLRRPRLSMDQLALAPGIRQEMLVRDWGVTFGQMHKAITETDCIKRWRLASATQGPHQMKVQEAFETTRKRVVRLISRRSEEKEIQLLWERARTEKMKQCVSS
mmetsp:Transcript_21579/g.31919  ORF Transcript_21579/g.31919 Transcript_21579/m.31919 type:complete len:212 (+) Transcript_21579:92-727(+)